MADLDPEAQDADRAGHRTTAMYSVKSDGTKTDKWIWDELLGEDAEDWSAYATVLGTDDPDTPTSLAGTTEGAIKGWETRRGGGVPEKAPGTTPIPPGKIRGYHYTEAMDAVEQGGLDVSKAKGSTYGEPNMIWFSTEKPRDDKDFVEVFLDPKEVGIGNPTMSVKRPEGWQPAKTPEEQQEVLDDYNHGNHNFTVRTEKIPPDRFVTTHRPWHSHYRHMEENAETTGKDVLAGEFDWALDEPEYAPAVLAYKEKYGKTKLTYREKLAFFLKGTTEGALLGWETRRHGGGAEHKPLAAKLAKGLIPTDSYYSTKFILPDGTRLTSTPKEQKKYSTGTHDEAATDAGVKLYEALAEGVVRYSPGTGAEVGGPITEQQAAHLVDAALFQKGNQPLHVDVFRGRARDSKEFDVDRDSADTVRRWVNAHYLSRLPLTGFFLKGTTEGALLGWETRRGGAGPAEASAPRSHPATPEAHAQFREQFEAAFKDSPYSAFVTHYTQEEMDAGKMVPITSHDGKAGMLVKDHGDGRIEGTALFNRSGEKGAGIALLKEAIAKHGVNYAEAYGPYLPALYATLGFETDEQYTFDPSMAAPNWNTEKFDAPDYHTMRLKK